AAARLEALRAVLADNFDGAVVGVPAGVEAWVAAEGTFRTAAGRGVASTSAKVLGADGVLGDRIDVNMSTARPIDLSRASSAFLAFRHRYLFEEGYDGAVVEASSDSGANWTRLTRVATTDFALGYSGPVVAANPLVPGGDPAAPALAFTGESSVTRVGAASDGWVPAVFDLGTVPGFRRSVPVRAFALAHASGTPAQSDVGLFVGASGSWATVTERWRASPQVSIDTCSGARAGAADNGSRFASCWTVENLTRENPISPRGPAKEFLWSGWSPSGTAGTRSLFVNLTLPPAGSGLEPVLRYWEWRDGALSPGATDVNGSAGEYRICYDPDRNGCVGGSAVDLDVSWGRRILSDEERATCGAEPQTSAATQDGLHARAVGWRCVEVPLAYRIASGARVLLSDATPVSFTFEMDLGEGQSNRGWAVDNLTLETFRPAGFLRRDRTTMPVDLCDPATLRGDGTFVSGCPRPFGGFSRTLAGSAGNTAWNATAAIDAASRPTVAWSLSAVEPSSDTRLVAPVIDLSQVDSGNVTFRFLRNHSMDHGNSESSPSASAAIVAEVQVCDRAVGSGTCREREAWGPWTQVFDARGAPPNVSASQGTAACSEQGFVFKGDFHGYDSAAWKLGLPFDSRPGLELCRVNDVPVERAHNVNYFWAGTTPGPVLSAVDLTPFVGRIVRVAFRVWTNPSAQSGSLSLELSDIEVVADAMTAGPLDLRFRAATDGSRPEGGWRIDDVRVLAETYERAVLLTVDGAMPTRLAPDRVLPIPVTVRNLGNATGDLTVVLAADGSLPLPRLELAPGAEASQRNYTVEDGRVRIGYALGRGLTAAGGSADGASVAFRARFDPGTVGTANFTLSIEEGSGTSTTPLATEVPGLSRSRFRVGAVVAADLLVRLGLDPVRLVAENSTNATLVIENNGTVHETVSPRLTLERFAGGAFTPVLTVPVPAATLGPGETRTVTQRFDVGQDPAAYRVVAEVGDERASEVLLARVSGVARTDDFETEEDRRRFRAEPAGSPWEGTDEDSARGSFSYRFGPRLEDYEDGAGYPGGFNTTLTSDATDLRVVPGDRAFLTFLYKARFGPDDGFVVEAQTLDPESGAAVSAPIPLTPIGGYPGNTTSVDGGQDGVSNINPLGSRPAFAGFSTEWRLAEFDLGAAALMGEVVRFIFRVGTIETPSTTGQRGQGFLLDEISVSPYRLRILPGTQRLPIADGTTKEFHLRLENAGTAEDDVRLELDEDRSRLPRKIDLFRVLDPSVRLAPGGAKVLRVEAATPVDVGLLSDLFYGTIVARSAIDATRTATGRIDVNVSVGEHPNLATEVSVEGAMDGVEEQVNTTVVAVVTNRGTAASLPTDVRFVARHVETNRTQEFGVRSLGALASALDGGASDAVAVVTADWKPESLRGPWEVTAEVDAARRLLDFDRASNRASTVVLVVAQRRPDVSVEPREIRVVGLAGLPLDRVAAGDLVRVEAVLRNLGVAPAVNVTAKLLVGDVILKEATFSLLRPGERLLLTGQQFVEAGSARVRVVVETESIESRRDNNAASVLLSVLATDLVLSATPATAAGDAGGSVPCSVKGRNCASRARSSARAAGPGGG
ncbi:MAG: hypothetical protein ACT4PT_07485, partial [Methanobacteriota archaeon]